MSLQSLHIALQGAGFPLSPIALAVQGLIALIQEEQRNQVYGKGNNPSHVTVPWRDGAPSVKQDDPEEIERLVREKWDAIERAQDEGLAPAVSKDHQENHDETKQPVALENKAVEAMNIVANRAGFAKNASLNQIANLPISQDLTGMVIHQRRQEAAALAAARRRADEEALILLLAEL